MMTKSIHYHFSRIARRYRSLRRTDSEPIIYIRKRLRKFTRIRAADVGCGDGRYDVKLFEYLGPRLFLYCIDCNQDMLDELVSYLGQHRIDRFQVRRAFADDLPLENRSLDCLFTFNAIHHFPLREFLGEAARVLRDEGYLFIYTRLRSQNARNIWGRYFPLFTEKETRLYELEQLEDAVEATPGLSIQSVEFFSYARVSSLDWLVEQAEHCHYSTFYLYSKEEFERSLSQFTQNLRRHFPDVNNITWFDENVLLVIRKQASGSRDSLSSAVPD